MALGGPAFRSGVGGYPTDSRHDGSSQFRIGLDAELVVKCAREVPKLARGSVPVTLVEMGVDEGSGRGFAKWFSRQRSCPGLRGEREKPARGHRATGGLKRLNAE